MSDAGGSSTTYVRPLSADQGATRILAVVDDPATGENVAAASDGREKSTDLEVECDVDGALARLETEPLVDCVVCEAAVSGMDGVTVLEQVRERDDAVPFVLSRRWVVRAGHDSGQRRCRWLRSLDSTGRTAFVPAPTAHPCGLQSSR